MIFKRWRNLEANKEIARQIADSIGIHPIVSQIIVNRGIQTSEDVQKFLFPTYKELHNPFLLNDMRKAVDVILAAIKENKKIVIFGDFDVDGVSSTTILMLFFRTFYSNIDYFIPVRFDGYGLNKKALKEIKDNGADLVISVDCGITAISEVEYCKEIGLDIIITDHHEPIEVLPDALAVVNPMREDNTYPYPRLAGAGVAYKLAVALQSELHVPEFSADVRELLDVCTFGTVADIMPLTGENRAIVKFGLDIMNDPARRRRGFKELMEVAGISEHEIKASHIGFQLAPRINALGRLQSVRRAVEMFLSHSEEESLEIAKFLDKENTERKAIQEQMTISALSMLPPAEEFNDYAIVLGHQDWHTGIKGIVASKVLDTYYRPSIMCAITEEGIAEGSARSIEGLHIRKALDECSDLLLTYGGHEGAAGLKLKAENLEAFRNKLNEVTKNTLSEDDLIPLVKYEMEIGLEDVTFDIIDQLTYLAPFGASNPSPLFCIKNLQVSEFKTISDGKHLKLKVTQNGHSIECIGFQYGELAQRMSKGEKIVSIVGSLEINEYQNRQSLQIQIKDIKFKEKNPELDRMDELFEQANLYNKDNKFINIGHSNEFNTKVVGVSFYDRQEIIDQLRVGEEVFLERDPLNPVDPNAIKVVTINGLQIGFLKAKLAEVLSKYLDSGEEYFVNITDLTGNTEEQSSYGVNLLVRKKNVSNEQSLIIDHDFRNQLEIQSDSYILSQIKGKLLGDKKYRPKQMEAITHLLNKENISVIMGTGRGKSAIFQTVSSYIAIKEKKLTIILYPLRALVNDQLNSMQEKFSPLGIKVFKGTGDLPQNEKTKMFEELQQGNIDILLTTPEFLYHYLDRFKVIRKNIGFVVIDEGHHIGKASELYRPAYKKIKEISESLDHPLFAVMTATCEDETYESICNQLSIRKIVIDPNIRTNLTIIDKRELRKKEEYINEVISTGGKTIVYVNSREKTALIAQKLKKSNPMLQEKIGFYHGGLAADDRVYIEKMFKEGTLSTIVSTSAFGEGVDIPDIKHVIHYHMPFNEIEFNQESGRAGRNGEKAYIHLLFGGSDIRTNDFIMETTAPNRETLIKVFSYFKNLTDNGQVRGELQLEAAEEYFKVRYQDDLITNRTLFTALSIFSELQIFKVNEGSGTYFIELMPTQKKMELSDSIIYQEGQNERIEYDEFKKWIMDSDSKKLLYSINRPIYPLKLKSL